MARYNSFKYGSGVKYGVHPVNRKLTWMLEVDWDNDGSFNGDNEALRGTDLYIRRGKREMLKSSNDGFETVEPGEVSITLNNYDGRFDPFNEDSPIYPYATPGCKFRLKVKIESSGSIVPVMVGNVKEIDEVTDANGNGQIVLRGVDRYEVLQNDTVVGSMQSNIAIEDAIQLVLDEVGWADGSYLEDSNETVVYWWPSGKTASKEIDLLTDTALAKFFIDSSGSARFVSRLVGHTPIVTISEEDILKGIQLLRPWKTIRNDNDIVVRTRTLQSSTTLWQLGDVPLIRAGASLRLWANYFYNNEAVPATNVVTPVATTDYLANTLSSGSGSNLTASFSVSMTAYADRAVLTITNTSGSDGYLTYLKVRGQPLITTPVTLNNSDTTSIARYQRKHFVLDTGWFQKVDTADDTLALLADFLSETHMYPTVRLLGYRYIQFQPDLFDVVWLDLPSKGIASRYMVQSIEHRWKNRGGDIIETTFRFEPEIVSSDNVWTFTATLGTNTRFAG